jgi:hypothetical protein
MLCSVLNEFIAEAVRTKHCTFLCKLKIVSVMRLHEVAQARCEYLPVFQVNKSTCIIISEPV